MVNKPAGLVVHRGWAQDSVTLMSLARDQIEAPVWPVHRLDRMTSGVIAFALSVESLQATRRAFESRAEALQKRYLALVRGAPGQGGVVRYAIPKTEDGPRVPAETRWRLLHQLAHYALIEARPITGRLHQIRRHAKHLNHPIVWDKKHGRGRFNERCKTQCGIDRMALHARSLALPHPFDDRVLQLRAPLPQDLAGPFTRLGIPPALWR